MNSMRAKIILLFEQEEARPVLRLAGQTLSDIAIAFGHSFSMLEGELSAYSSLESLDSFDGILFAGSRDAAQELAERVSCHSGISKSNAPHGLSDLIGIKQEDAKAPAVVWPVKTQEESLHKTAVFACHAAKEEGERLYLVPPELDSELWTQALSKAAMYSAQETPERLSLEDAMIKGIGSSQAALYFASFHDSKLLRRLWDHLFGQEVLGFVRYQGDERSFVAVNPVPTLGKPGLFSALYAAASLLKHSLNLPHEAECLKTVVDNVLTSGWRTPDFDEQGEKAITENQALRLVQEQVALAGELFDQAP